MKKKKLRKKKKILTPLVLFIYYIFIIFFFSSLAGNDWGTCLLIVIRMICAVRFPSRGREKLRRADPKGDRINFILKRGASRA